jgi:hypothetical protein
MVKRLPDEALRVGDVPTQTTAQAGLELVAEHAMVGDAARRLHGWSANGQPWLDVTARLCELGCAEALRQRKAQ